MTTWWDRTSGSTLAQGDFLSNCVVIDPVELGQADENTPFIYRQIDLIVVTQSCDLANDKSSTVLLCAIRSIEVMQQGNPVFRKKDVLESIRQGRRASHHMLASPEFPLDNAESLIVDLRDIYRLSLSSVQTHAAALGERWRLRSPYLEHFSQALARSFMRVGLPADIAPFR